MVFRSGDLGADPQRRRKSAQAGWFSCLSLLLAMLAGCQSAKPGPQAATTLPVVVPLDHLPALRGGYFPQRSNAVGRDFHIYVRVPENYAKNPDRRYPVVYVLDGDTLFPLLAPTQLLLTYDEKLPEAIIVGIAYGGYDPVINKRDVDFTAPAADAKPGHDGAPRFLEYLRTELLPVVESRFRVDPAKRVLLGQSRSGYFVLWSALEAPDLFWGRIASNPATTPGRDRFFAQAAPGKRNDLGVAVVIGSREPAFRRDFVQEWTDTWQARGDAPWVVERLLVENGTHAATIGENYRQAMLWLFRDEVGKASAEASAGGDH